MNKNGIIWLVVAIVVLGGAALYVSSGTKTTAGGATAKQAEYAPSAGATQTPAPAKPGQSVTVTYDGSSFSPAVTTIHVGDTITFVDKSSEAMWVASGVHPVHTLYDGTTLAAHCASGYTGPTPFDECAASTADYSFTFTKAGTWPFHNHVDASATGKIVVE